jgi:hypothetical protein
MYRPITRSKGSRAENGFDRSSYKANLPQSALSGPLFGDVENFLTSIDTDNGSFWAYRFGGEHGDIAGATAQVQNPHAHLNSRVAQEILGDRS